MVDFPMQCLYRNQIMSKHAFPNDVYPFLFCLNTGTFFPPTIISRPNLTDPVMTEEIFGPLIPILPFDTIDEAITISKRVCKRPSVCCLFPEVTRRASHHQ